MAALMRFIFDEACQKGDFVSLSVSLALCPGSHPAFRCLQYGKAERASYIVSHEHDLIEKVENIDCVWAQISKKSEGTRQRNTQI